MENSKKASDILLKHRINKAKKEHKNHKMHLAIAKIVAQRSYAKKKQVGAVLAKGTSIISYGYNGTPAGMSNVCETDQNKTLDIVVHAEMNAILKAAKLGISTEGTTLYITLSPCINCAKLILQSGVKEVIFIEEYKDLSAVDLLNEQGVICESIALKETKEYHLNGKNADLVVNGNDFILEDLITKQTDIEE